jgi:predicted CoA-binding protein
MNFKEKSFAVVGASNNFEKYGFKVVSALIKVSKKVYPVNPNESQILGQDCYAELKAIKEKVDVIVFVVPPQITIEILEENFARKSLFWFQPGSFNLETIRFCEENGIEYENKKCIIKESETKSD